MKKGVGAPGTGKRLINVRHFMEKSYEHQRCCADPFIDSIPAESVSEQSPVGIKLKFRTDYIPSDSTEDEDEILPKKRIDLDEAAKFVASLKIGKAKKAKKTESPVSVTVAAVLPENGESIQEFRDASEKLRLMRLKDTVESESEDDCLI
jgi:hypothetical protein